MSKKEYFIFDSSFDPVKDEIMEFLGEDQTKDYSAPSPDKIMPVNEYLKLGPSDVSKWFRENPSNSFSIYQKLRTQQLEELQKAKAELREFYTTVWTYSDYRKGGFSPMEIARLTLQKKIRVARIREVLSPQFAEVLVPHSKTKHKYWVARAYWWDDYGVRSRSINKSIRRSDNQIIEKLTEIYQDMDFEVVTSVKMKNNTLADMLIRKKQEEYIVEVKMMDFKDLSRFILSSSMWSDYKKIYLKGVE